MTETASTVEFIQFHQPPLDSGVYEITIEQEVDTGEGAETFSQQLKFAVAGHRYTPLANSDLYILFPPPGSLGDQSNVLPHVTFNRSTLPWERSVADDDLDLPWVALLVFRESEVPTPQPLTLETLKNTGGYSAKFPAWSEEPGEQALDELSVIDIPKSLLEQILPLRAELPYLGHVRQPKDKDGNPIDRELATFIANRLPKPGETTTVHLVSLENRYSPGGEFDYQGATGDDLIRLISLKSWSFACTAPDKTFTETLLHLNCTPNSLRLPALEPANAAAEEYLSMGYVPLNHGLRQGEKTVSWYHGPLSPGQNPGQLDHSVEAADALVRYDSRNGLFDSSYAAAWQLGRLLTLKNQNIAVQLYNWKRANSHALKELQNKVLHLPLENPFAQSSSSIPDAIADWFQDLELLKGIPFNYLVPDERLLPLESIRFFWVDSYWVDCLQDGAFSIGRVIKTDTATDTRMRRASRRRLRGNADEMMTGILLRSEVISGWPGLLVDGYGTNIGRTRSSRSFVPEDNPLPLLRMEKLSENVLICLFAGEAKTVDIHLKPETMQFGVDPYTIDDTKFTKGLRDPMGNETKIVIDVPCRNFEQGIIDIAQFTTEIKGALSTRSAASEFTSAQFGLEMIEGVQKVRFNQE